MPDCLQNRFTDTVKQNQLNPITSTCVQFFICKTLQHFVYIDLVSNHPLCHWRAYSVSIFTSLKQKINQTAERFPVANLAEENQV
jgi:hypothetical protein